MADNEQKAMQLVADAEKKLKSSQGFLGGLFRKEIGATVFSNKFMSRFF